MVIHVLAFGIAKEILENESLQFDLQGAATVSNLKTLLEKQYPGLKKLGSYLVAVNNEYSGNETSINANDEIALIPPVSGG
jgi:molybdopterin converting factor subunit 1